MRDWFVLTHNPLNHLSLMDRLHEMGVEVYSPCRIKLYKRKDRPSSLRREEQLFPGYLLVNFDPFAPLTHPSKITGLNGAYGFLQFGELMGRVKAEVIDELREGLLRTDRSLSCFEYHSLPSELGQSLFLITEMRSESARKAAFFSLLQHYYMLERLACRAAARIYSSLRPL